MSLESLRKKLEEELNNSPMFNLSLSSKELFHSNFIDWLITKEKEKMSKLFSELLDKDIEIKFSLREKNNFDLYLKCEGGLDVVIENKFKSIITREQLEKYNEKLKKLNINPIKVLLSFHLTDYEKQEVEVEQREDAWKVISYSEFIEKLRKVELELEDKYHKNLINDYCYFVDNLIKYFGEINYESMNLSDMYLEVEELKKIRIHDLGQKFLFNYLLMELKRKLDKDKFDYTPGFVFDKNKFKKNKISLWQGFWRGTGLVSLNYTLDSGKDGSKEFRLELQLQYDSLKLMLIHENDPRGLDAKFRDDYFKIIEYYSKQSEFCEGTILYPKGKSIDYNKYGEDLIYKRIKLSPEMTFEKVIDLMYEMFNEVIKFAEDYKKKMNL